MATKKPSSLTIRMYQVGFGDCFLLSFRYAPKEERHVLIDFGSTGTPVKAPKNLMRAVAENIRDRCGGKLDAVVATHRHRDHIGGFATGGKNSSGDIIAACKPRVVVQPWTEHPDAAKTATAAPSLTTNGKAFVRSLANMQQVAASVVVALHRGRKIGATAAREIAFIGEDNLPNVSAVKNLQKMGKKNVYVNYGSKSGLETVLPGVKIHVLGPPNLKQSETIRKERARDDEEFWHLQGRAVDRMQSETPQLLFPRAGRFGHRIPPSVRWLQERLDGMRGEELREIVRALDDVMNNTSVILLFEAGKKRLLFPGDAQIENWSYALTAAKDKDKVRALLRGVDFYKVGHHGSLNATPKTVWNLFAKRSKKRSATRLRTMMSTMPGKHGHANRGTEVPRQKLLEALSSLSSLISTEIPKSASGHSQSTFFKAQQLFEDLELTL